MIARLKGASGEALADARGLALAEKRLSAFLRPVTFLPLFELDTSVALKPGEETPVSVAVPQLPANADVKRIRATLHVSAAKTAGEPEETQVKVTSGAGTAASSQDFNVAVEPPALPRNVQLRLDGGETFWTHGGILQAGSHELPDFADAANAYLDAARLPAQTQTTLAFMVRSETAGVARITVDEGSLDYAVLQTQTWPNPLDGSVRIDRNFDLEFGKVLRIPLDALAPPAGGLSLAGVRVDVTGQAGPERLLGDVPTHDGRELATLSTDYSLAQGVLIASGAESGGLGFPEGGVVRVAGIAVLAELESQAELYVELQRDAGGGPAGEEPLGGANIELAPGEGAAGPAWVYIPLPTPVELTVDVPVWVVLRSVRGQARVALGPSEGYRRRLLVNRGGQLWRALDPSPTRKSAALIGVAYLPMPDNQTSALAVGVEGRPQQPADIGPQVQRLVLEPAHSTGPAAIVVTSHARGSLALSNVVQEFARTTGASK